MDALAGLLDGPRAREAFVLRSILDPPWSLRIQDEAPLTVVIVIRGEAWIMPDSGEPFSMSPGDTAILRGPDHYTAADEPTTPPQIIIHPGQICTTPDGRDIFKEMSVGVRTWGNSEHGSTILLTGTYTSEGEVSRTLKKVLPSVVLIRDTDAQFPVVGLLADEISGEELGQSAVLDRLLDLHLVMALRSWFRRPNAEGHEWYKAHADPIVGRALQLIHDRPSHPWTVSTLASTVGASRASFARRFASSVGQTPIAYLTAWRLGLAADLLRQTDTTVAAVAQQVGYASAYSFSTAFKRTYGMSPSEFQKSKPTTTNHRSEGPRSDERH